MATSAAAVKDEPATQFAKDQLKAIIERIERLEEEKKTISDDIRDVYAEAKGNGFDVKALRTIVRLRKQDANERAEEETILETYMLALGMLGGSVVIRGLAAFAKASAAERIHGPAKPLAETGPAYPSNFKMISERMDCRVVGSKTRGALMPGNDSASAQRSEAVCITKDCVASFAVADPEKRSVTIPICGSSEKVMAIAACGLTK